MVNILSSLDSIGFNSYKSFRDKYFTISMNQNTTLIIGRNNTGKSSLIDVIEYLITSTNSENSIRGVGGGTVAFSLDSNHIEAGFRKDVYNSGLWGKSDFEYGIQFDGKILTLASNNTRYEYKDDQNDLGINKFADVIVNIKHNWNEVAIKYSNDMKNVAFRRLNAERDIVPEIENDNEQVDDNGNGATNLIRKYINTDTYDEAIIEKRILDQFNLIMEPDAHFNSIRIQQIGRRTDDGYRWEVFLEEGNHRYAMSKMGSGLKTVLLILINLYLIPCTKQYKDKEIFYAFEEIENNLHPALQRRVFDYLYKYSKDNNIKTSKTTKLMWLENYVVSFHMRILKRFLTLREKY